MDTVAVLPAAVVVLETEAARRGDEPPSIPSPRTKPHQNGQPVDDTQVLPSPEPPASETDDERPPQGLAQIADAVHWLAKHYVMSDASAGILLRQLARQAA